jgi:hypothetical protein
MCNFEFSISKIKVQQLIQSCMEYIKKDERPIFNGGVLCHSSSLHLDPIQLTILEKR